MATIRSITLTYTPGPPASKKLPVAGVIVSLDLTEDEARVLPRDRGLRRAFGPAVKYNSFVKRTSAELVVRYALRDAPFGSTDAEKIPELARAHISEILRRLQNGVGGN